MNKTLKNPIDWSEGFGCGAMFAATVYTIALAFFMKIDKTDFSAYATIWAGLLAQFGAWITLRGLRDQTQINIDIFLQNENQRTSAARSVLGLLLSEISEVSEKNVLRNFDPSMLPIGKKPPTTFTSISPETLSQLKEAAPLFPAEVANRITNILSVYQVLKSRDKTRKHALINSSRKWVYGEHEAVRSAIDWAVIRLKVDSIFPYARGSEDAPLTNVDPASVEGSFQQCGIVASDIPKVCDAIKRRSERDDLDFDFAKRYAKRWGEASAAGSNLPSGGGDGSARQRSTSMLSRERMRDGASSSSLPPGGGESDFNI
jgi:hypothetical protein